MSILENISASIGRARAAYEKALISELGHIKRPAFLAAWAESEKWKGGDLGTRDAAQQRAMQNSWLFTAIGMIAREVSATDLKILQHQELNSEPLDIPDHVFLRIARRPNPVMGRAYLWQYTTNWLCLDGNAYWYLAPDEDGNLAEIWPLPSNGVEVWPGDDQRFVDFYRLTVMGQQFDLPAERICHFMFPNPYDVFRGLSPLTAGMLPIDADTAMARWNGAFFGQNNVMPSAIINLSSGNAEIPVDKSDTQDITDRLQTDYQAAQRKTLVTNAPSGMQVNLLGWSAKDMDFLSGRQFTKDEIFSIFGIPGGLLDKNATEANAQTADRIFKEKTIWPILALIAEQITAQVVIPVYGSDYESAFEDIRPTNKSVNLQEATASQGVLTINEVRQKYWKMPPLPDEVGKVLYVANPAPAATDPFGGILGAPQPNVPALPPGEVEQRVQNAVLGGTEAAKPTSLDDTPVQTQTGTPMQKSVNNPEELIAGTAEQPGVPAQPFHDRVMVCMSVPIPRAQAIALHPIALPAGSEVLDPEELQLTIAYLGKVSDLAIRPEEVQAAVNQIFNGVGPVTGKISGVGRFYDDEGDGENAFYLSVDMPGIQELRKSLVGMLSDMGCEVPAEHEFTPHITLAYIPKEAEAPHIDLSGLDVTFYSVSVKWGEKDFTTLLIRKAESSEFKEDQGTKATMVEGVGSLGGYAVQNVHPRGEAFDAKALDDQDTEFEKRFTGRDLSEGALKDLRGSEQEYRYELGKLQRDYDAQMEEMTRTRNAAGMARIRDRFIRDKRFLQTQYSKRVDMISGNQLKSWELRAAQEDRIAQVAIKADLKRWKEKSVKAVQDEKPANVPFASEVIPGELTKLVRDGLTDAESVEEVKAVFGGIDLSKQAHRLPDKDALAGLTDELRASRELLERSMEVQDTEKPADESGKE